MKKWNDLATALRNEPMILGERITGHVLKDRYLRGMAVKKEEKGKIIAFAAIWPTTDSQFLEVGSFWVEPIHRGKKYCNDILSQITSMKIKETIFIITHNKKVVHLLQKDNWKKVTAPNWSLRIPITASCGPCDEVREEEKINCSNKAQEGKCLMFFLKK